MDDSPGDGAPESLRVRRRLPSNDAGEGTEGRSGCLVAGAVLGVLLGAIFAFFALPPLVNHFFAEEQVPPGQAYSAGGRTVRAVTVEQTALSTVVHLEMTVNTTWTPKAANFTLEYSTGGSWAKALSVLDAATGQPLDFDVAHLGKRTEVSVAFRYEPERGTPRYIHLGDPHIRLEMLEVAAP
jgi:hypothetical protein